MAKPSEKLAESLDVLHNLQECGSILCCLPPASLLPCHVVSGMERSGFPETKSA